MLTVKLSSKMMILIPILTQTKTREVKKEYFRECQVILMTAVLVVMMFQRRVGQRDLRIRRIKNKLAAVNWDGIDRVLYNN